LTGALIALSARRRNRTMRNVGLIAMAAGIAAMIASEGMAPEADTRNWSLLPSSLVLAVGRAKPGQPTALEIRSDSFRGSQRDRFELTLEDRENFLWVRLLPLGPESPSDAASRAVPREPRTSRSRVYW
jgi:hypothetical protein